MNPPQLQSTIFGTWTHAMPRTITHINPAPLPKADTTNLKLITFYLLAARTLHTIRDRHPLTYRAVEDIARRAWQAESGITFQDEIFLMRNRCAGRSCLQEILDDVTNALSADEFRHAEGIQLSTFKVESASLKAANADGIALMQCTMVRLAKEAVALEESLQTTSC
jgi:hypothetical protein